MANGIAVNIDDDKRLVQLCMKCNRFDCPGICGRYRQLREDILKEALENPQAAATNAKPTRRRRSPKLIFEKDGEKHTLREWSEITGIRYITLYSRIVRGGIPFENALYPPTRFAPHHEKIYICNGKSQSLAAWARELGVSKNTLRVRLQRGWTTERALSTSKQHGGRKKRQAVIGE